MSAQRIPQNLRNVGNREPGAFPQIVVHKSQNAEFRQPNNAFLWKK